MVQYQFDRRHRCWWQMLDIPYIYDIIYVIDWDVSDRFFNDIVLIKSFSRIQLKEYHKSENGLHLFSTKIAVYRKESNSIGILISWQWRGNDFVVFAVQFPYLGHSITKLRWDKKYHWFYMGYFYTYLGSFTSKSLPRASVSTKNHCKVTNGDRAMISTSLCEITDFSPLVVFEFSNCWGVVWVWTLIAAYDVCCFFSCSSRVLQNLP